MKTVIINNKKCLVQEFKGKETYSYNGSFYWLDTKTKIIFYFRGFEAYMYNNRPHWNDTEQPVDYERPCKKCGKVIPKSTPDPCFGKLPFVRAACCGHGIKGQRYIYMIDRKYRLKHFSTYLLVLPYYFIKYLYEYRQKNSKQSN